MDRPIDIGSVCDEFVRVIEDDDRVGQEVSALFGGGVMEESDELLLGV